MTNVFFFITTPNYGTCLFVGLRIFDLDSFVQVFEV